MTTLPLHTIIDISNNVTTPPADSIGIIWNAGLETWDMIRKEWPATPVRFSDDELAEEIVVLTEADVLDEAASILADRLSEQLWDTDDGLIEDPERRGGIFSFWRTWDEHRGRGIEVTVERQIVDEVGEVTDWEPVFTTTA